MMNQRTDKILDPATFWLEDGIVFGKLAENTIVDLKTAREIVAARKYVFGTTHLPILMDINNLLAIDGPARQYFASAEACEFISAGAIYTNNKLLALLGNAWMKLDKPIVPMGIFSSPKTAIVFLDPFRSLGRR